MKLTSKERERKMIGRERLYGGLSLEILPYTFLV